MGRPKYSNRSTVDECKPFTSKFLKEHHYYVGGPRRGVAAWKSNGNPVGNVGFVVSTVENSAYVRFQYTLSPSKGRKTDFDYKVMLDSTPCFFGGHRWWFICPGVAGRSCNRRVGVLHLKGPYFGCRHCHNLTYTSCKESDKRISALRKDEELLLSYFNSTDLSKKLLAMKAERKGPMDLKKSLKNKNPYL